MRDLRSQPGPFDVSALRALPLAYGAPILRRLLAESPAYDLILHFAALKHVRSEKDVYSLVQMLDTNLVKQERLLNLMAEAGWGGRYFCVSTDKAANPVNLMGASKRVMEHLIFTRVAAMMTGASVTSARFANVAFSNGSLLAGFLHRLEKRQPLSVPRDTRRYFVSLPEAGRICLLAACVAPDHHIVIPRLSAERDLVDRESLACAILDHAGFKARIYEDEAESKSNLASDVAAGRYPLLVTELDTSGEEPFEEFVGEDDEIVDFGLETLAVVRCRTAQHRPSDSAY